MAEPGIRGQELKVRRALLYAPPPPARLPGQRRVYWTRERALAALRTLDAQPSLEPWLRRRPRGMPSASKLKVLFGSWSAAMEAAGWEPRPTNARFRDDELAAQLQARVDAGATLAELADELGITQQALGRRLARHRDRFPRDDYVIPTRGRRAR